MGRLEVARDERSVSQIPDAVGETVVNPNHGAALLQGTDTRQVKGEDQAAEAGTLTKARGLLDESPVNCMPVRVVHAR